MMRHRNEGPFQGRYEGVGVACAAIRSQGPSRAQPCGGRGDYGPQDPADPEAVYPSQGEGSGGEVGVVASSARTTT